MSPINAPYCGPAPSADALWLAWNTDWRLWLALTLMLAVTPRVSNRRAFLLAWAGLWIAFVSPLCALTVALFSARTLHHLLLLCAVAPLLALAAGAPRRWASALAPALAVIALLTLWHLPRVYSLAWSSPSAYWGLQLGLLAAGVQFWRGVLHAGRQQLIAPLSALAAVTATMGMIGAVLTFAPQVLYGEHFAATLSFGIGPLADQQLAGLLMWVPGFVPFACAAGMLARRLFARDLAAGGWA